ncbi:MAG: hypothetical protein ACUVS2_12080 [Candidatus Flexifilum sp.]
MMPDDALRPEPDAISNQDFTIPSRVLRREAPSAPPPRRTWEAGKEPPTWLLAAMNGESGLDRDWAARYPQMPLMTQIRFETGMATLATQDGAAGMSVIVDAETRQLAVTYTLGGMLGLRFTTARLSDADRTRWIALMRQPGVEPIFLWGQARWETDFLIFSARTYYVNVYAYSPRGVEAAARLTVDVTRALVEWIAARWR